MTKEDKVIRMSENLDLRPSTAAIAVEMLDKQKEFLMALAENEYNRGVTDALGVIDEMERDTSYVFAMVDGKANGVLCNSRDVRDRILALKGGE